MYTAHLWAMDCCKGTRKTKMPTIRQNNWRINILIIWSNCFFASLKLKNCGKEVVKKVKELLTKLQKKVLNLLLFRLLSELPTWNKVLSLTLIQQFHCRIGFWPDFFLYYPSRKGRTIPTNLQMQLCPPSVTALFFLYFLLLKWLSVRPASVSCSCRGRGICLSIHKQMPSMVCVYVHAPGGPTSCFAVVEPRAICWSTWWLERSGGGTGGVWEQREEGGDWG